MTVVVVADLRENSLETPIESEKDLVAWFESAGADERIAQCPGRGPGTEGVEQIVGDRLSTLPKRFEQWHSASSLEVEECGFRGRPGERIEDRPESSEHTVVVTEHVVQKLEAGAAGAEFGSVQEFNCAALSTWFE
ncbi:MULTISPECIES: hypothetical protein [Nocardiaceae]|uniref:Uncharacterized protein n=1 Tax=Nocardia thailandica TaxID=257275 RepID=A0ABW6PXW6_9NOCA|nr:hypothetical protein [Rhodococcus pyridinivorans]QQM55136.1 hypothetical protein JGU70_11190 [Rhodococcus pyridinivorans]BDU04587.1 hypothetical protein FMUBM48_08500 [Nocardia cyriacigeorgica]